MMREKISYITFPYSLQLEQLNQTFLFDHLHTFCVLHVISCYYRYFLICYQYSRVFRYFIINNDSCWRFFVTQVLAGWVWRYGGGKVIGGKVFFVKDIWKWFVRCKDIFRFISTYIQEGCLVAASVWLRDWKVQLALFMIVFNEFCYKRSLLPAFRGTRIGIKKDFSLYRAE